MKTKLKKSTTLMTAASALTLATLAMLQVTAPVARADDPEMPSVTIQEISPEEALAKLPDTITTMQRLSADQAYGTAMDPKALTPIGGTLRNRKTGETIEAVCLEAIAPETPCDHFQLRDTKDGVAKLIGSEFVMSTFPKEALKSALIQENKDKYRGKKWKYLTTQIAQIDDDDDDAKKIIVSGVAVTGMTVMMATGTIGLVYEGGIIGGAVLLDSGVVALERTIVKINEGVKAHKLKRAIDTIFSGPQEQKENLHDLEPEF